jgi:hypothetical protein
MAKAKKASAGARKTKKAVAKKRAPAKKRARPKKPAAPKKKRAATRLRAVLSMPWPTGGPALDPASFLRALPPMKDVRKPGKAELAKLGHRLPKRFLDFLAKVGFGRFGEGFLTIAHPHDLDEMLADWLGGFDPSRVPFARTALGDLFFFRDRRSSAAMLGRKDAAMACDIGLVFPRHKKSAVVAEDLPQLVEQIFGQSKTLETLLRKDLFDRALERLGPPAADELYGFVPAVALGGAEEPAALERVKASEHVAVLLQL